MLGFELLSGFVAVADCGGFDRAAKQLNLTQSTVRPADQATWARDQASLVPADDAQRRADG
jgi:hypothetical protein